MRYRKIPAAKQVYVKHKISEALSLLRIRLKLQISKHGKCKHCCLLCAHYKMCACDHLSTEVEYKDYTVIQSGLNNHISIYNNEGKLIYHTQQRKRLKEQDLKKQVDFYLHLIKKVK